jgi:hypothetical protein
MAASLRATELAELIRNAPPIDPLKAPYDWNVPDVMGKYHDSRIKSKFGPLGTQLKRDRKHAVKKKEDYDRMHNQLASRALRAEKRAPIIAEKSEFNTRVYFDVVTKEPIKTITGVVDEKAGLAVSSLSASDTAKEKKRFIRSMREGRSHYVASAIMAGYRSVDVQDDATGNCGLHYAVQSGNVEMLEALLKYKADPQLRNRLGYYPINLAWDFWVQDGGTTQDGIILPLSKEKREAQENRTCHILHLLLSYDASPDAPQQDGNTVLHMAVRKGPLRAVLLLMGFEATTHLKNMYGFTAPDMALRRKNRDMAKIFRLWETIQAQMLNEDFVNTWRRFLKDTAADMSHAKSAEEVIFEIRMEEGIKLINQETGSEFRLDDDMLREAKDAEAANQPFKVPLPWERPWKSWVKAQRGDVYGKPSTAEGARAGSRAGVAKDKEAEKMRNKHMDAEAREEAKVGLYFWAPGLLDFWTSELFSY